MPKYEIYMNWKTSLEKYLSTFGTVQTEVISPLEALIYLTTTRNLTQTEIDKIKAKIPFAEVTKLS